MNGIRQVRGKTWFWELGAAVIDADRCIQCGACVAVCPSDSIGVGENGLPMLVKMCTGCSLCWDFCPRGGLRYEASWPEEPELPLPSLKASSVTCEPSGAQARPADPLTASRQPAEPIASTTDDGRIRGGKGQGLGVVRHSYTTRSRSELPHIQDGGVVTELLIANLEAGTIDGALVARPSDAEKWKGIPHLATTAEEILECGGSFYNQTMALAHLDLAGYDLPPEPHLAVVGTPCEVEALRAIQAQPWWRGSSKIDAVVLSIALLCTKSFDYQGLMLRELRDERGLDLDVVDRVDVLHGKLIVSDDQGRELVREPIKNFHGAALKGCDECADFLGRGADISVGSVGSPDGWSSVLVRTPAGAQAFDLAAPRLEIADLERPEALAKLDAHDRQTALATLRRDFNPDGPLFWSYEEHVAAYTGSDRAPVVRQS
ncbi:MAG: Coenzyme F420 hydrogenase/dehydrogenase, beta subunit C-terminal domain [Acidimicrobiaceae bacterium]|nr:Coenzyme F420 hydrogenase/dehydrogenase, beta subunit C-terminal domain [Acidimicrobiaceae bacterium]